MTSQKVIDVITKSLTLNYKLVLIAIQKLEPKVILLLKY